ncbi:MAG: 4-alpha-glucanotransferase [Eubacterium sp.]|nr:4-alpha-glucanotransferase [Eubacterium sp.]
MKFDRKCGILTPVSALPGPYGIGCFGEEAYRFVDFLSDTKQSYWQILPLGQTGFGDSPYQSVSTYAGNPYFIDLRELAHLGYIGWDDLNGTFFGEDEGLIDYGALYGARYPILRRAYENSPYALHPHDWWAGGEHDNVRTEFGAFVDENSSWIWDFALFSSIKKAMDDKPYLLWEDGLRLRRGEDMERAYAQYADDVRFYCFIQFHFFRQWKRLKAYANERGIMIIGDIPIYVAPDSADTWSHPGLFMLEDDGTPTMVAGVPPDAFSEDGQLWGNPLYRWSEHESTGYEWWISRLAHAFSMYDVVRIDHFRGFESFYAIPYGQETARDGEWMKGPGYPFFSAVEEALGDRPIIAEDLGYLTPEVKELLEQCGYPGMKVLEFAFGSGPENDYLPHRYPENCVAYTGTHDNETLLGWYYSLNAPERDFVRTYTGVPDDGAPNSHMIRALFMSKADTVIVPIQDYLCLDNHARINTPSTMGGNNWRYRLPSVPCDGGLIDRISAFVRMYGRG